MTGLLCALLLAQAFDLREGTLTYTVVHKLHEVKGTSRELQGRAVLQGGTLKVQVRATVASFDSGNGNRDEHVREVTHEPVHPFAQVKGTAPNVSLSGPSDVKLNATVELNGVQRQEQIEVHLEPQGGGVRAKFSFPISLDAFKVERPELLFVKVEDKATIDGDLVFSESGK
ncbi:MAG: YceI family protein [Myxococcales bacterium]